MTRLSVTLTRGSTYRLVADGATLRVLLAPSGPAVPLPAAAAHPSEPVMGAVVRDVRFERVAGATAGCGPYGCDRVTVDLGSIPAYSLTTTSTGRLRLEMRGTSLPDPLARTVDVTAYHGALRSITASRDAEAKTASIELERSTEVPGSLSVEGGTLVWSFPVPELQSGRGAGHPGAPRRTDRRQGRRRRAPGRHFGPRARAVQFAEDRDLDPRGRTCHRDVDRGRRGVRLGAADVLAQQRYNGRRIDIDLKDADIHNVLRLLADTGHVTSSRPTT